MAGGLTGNYERDLPITLDKLNIALYKLMDLMEKSIRESGGVKSGGAGSNKLNLSVNDVVSALGDSEDAIEKFLISFRKAGPSAKDYIDELNLAAVRHKSHNDSIESLDKETANLTEAFSRTNKTAEELANAQSDALATLNSLITELRNQTENSTDLSEAGLRSKEELEKLIEAQKDLLSQLNGSIDAEQRSAAAKQHLTLVTEQLQSLSHNTLKTQGNLDLAIARSARQHAGLSTQTAKSARASSLLSAAQIDYSYQLDIGSAEFDGYKDALKEAASRLPASMLSAMGMFDETSQAIKDNLSPEEFAKLRIALGETRVAAAEALRGIPGVERVQDLMANGELDFSKLTGPGEQEETKKALLAIAAKLEDMGVVQPKAGEFSAYKDVDGKKVRKNISDIKSDAEIKKLAKSLAAFDNSVEQSVKSLDQLGKISHSVIAKQAFLLKSTGGLIGLIKKHYADLGSAAVFTASMVKTWDALKRVGQEISSFNIAHVPASFGAVQAASIKLGMSFDDTVKYLQENRRALGLVGPEMMTAMTSGFKDTFAKFGYTAAQSAELVGPALEAAINSGISIRDPAKLNSFIEQSMQSFKNIAGVVNMTAREYMQLNAQLMTDNDITAIGMGMRKEEQAEYAKSIIAMRDDYIARGLSAEQAQEMVRAQESLKREKIVGKYKESAMAQAKMQMMGFSADEAAEFARIRTVGARAGTDEQQRYNDMLKRMTAMEDQAREQGRASGTIEGAFATNVPLDIIGEKTGSLQTEQDRIRRLNVADRNESGIRNKEEQDRIAEASIGSAKVAEAGNIINSVTSLMQNSFTTALLASTAALLGFSSMLARAGGWQGLATIGKDAGTALKTGKGISGKIGGVGRAVLGLPALGLPDSPDTKDAQKPVAKPASKMGGLASKAGNFLKGGGLVGMVGGIVGGAISDIGDDKIAEAKQKGETSGTGLLMSIGGNAATGAALGSVIPGVGTVIGAGLGAAGGLAYGLYKNSSNISDLFSSPKEQKPEPIVDIAKPKEQKPTSLIDIAKPKEQKPEPIVDIAKPALMQATPLAEAVVGKISASPSNMIASPGNVMPGLLNSTTPSTDLVNKKSDKIDVPALIQVSDDTANSKLSEIAASLTEAVKLLKEMSEADIALSNAGPVRVGPDNTERRARVMASQYTSGRASA